jgi:hypothetical protein
MYLECDEVDKAFGPLVSRASVNGVSISPFVILCVLRRLVNVRLYAKSDIQKASSVWVNLLIEFLSLQRQSAPHEFIETKAAMCKLFGLAVSNFSSAPIEVSRLIDGTNNSLYLFSL